MSEFQREQHGKQKTCVSCLHTRCLFYGENRLPIYNGAAGKTNCWDNAAMTVRYRPVAGGE